LRQEPPRGETTEHEQQEDEQPRPQVAGVPTGRRGPHGFDALFDHRPVGPAFDALDDRLVLIGRQRHASDSLDARHLLVRVHRRSGVVAPYDAGRLLVVGRQVRVARRGSHDNPSYRPARDANRRAAGTHRCAAV
jgi:hypothetical protein